MANLAVHVNKKTDNPFYGMRNTLELYQNASKGTINQGMLDRSWSEAQKSKEGREMFFSLLFSIGDITARQHNIFKGVKTDSGGSSQREPFLLAFEWLKKNNYPQFKKFLFANLFNEFTSFDTLLKNRVKTAKKTKRVESVTSSLSGTEEYLNDLAEFCASVIKGRNPSDKHLLAKFLTRPRLSKRKNHKTMLLETKANMGAKQHFLKLVCDKAGLPYVKKTTHVEFTGYINWRKEYIGELESVMFASGKVREFDKDSFLLFLEKLPATARYRVRCRVLDKDNKCKEKWGDIGNWFLAWEQFKETKQTEVRVVEEKVRQGTATEEEKESVVKLKKEAKVTVGAVEFEKLFTEIILGSVDKLKLQPFLDKIKLDFNNLVFIDDSRSMTTYKTNGITAFDFAAFMATICLTKNPSEEGRSLLGFYSSHARLYNTMTSRAALTGNSILRTSSTKVSEPLLDPNLHFLDNLKRIREFSHAVQTGNGTNISSIPEYLKQQLQGDLTMTEQLQHFPVWTIISDGNWNNMPSPESSINDFMKRCEMYFGFRPFIIAIDVAGASSAKADRFSGIDNFMFVPPNPAQIEQLLTNFKDMDVMDVYTPLQSFHRSNRYELVRKNTI
jgi:hypothetical protein